MLNIDALGSNAVDSPSALALADAFQEVETNDAPGVTVPAESGPAVARVADRRSSRS